MAEITPRWTRQEIQDAAEITASDIWRALDLLREASPELADMVLAEESE
ncbi:MAG: hypothetical protein V7638_3833 [Acidobacteriota bacterium]|jgi:hypothetical protein